jgi:hypothetical protein
VGQQQLIIIVLIALLVGLSVSAGLRYMSANNQSNEVDLIMQQMNTIVGEAKQYALKPRSLAGGEGSFDGFTPDDLLLNTERVRISFTVGSDWILMQGYGSVEGWDGENPVQVVAQYNETEKRWTSVARTN